MVKNEELEEAVIGAIEWVEKRLQPGDRTAIHPNNFEILDDYSSDEEELKERLINCFFKNLGFNPKDSKPISEDLGIKKYITNRENILLGYDGIDWWLELKG